MSEPTENPNPTPAEDLMAKQAHRHVVSCRPNVGGARLDSTLLRGLMVLAEVGAIELHLGEIDEQHVHFEFARRVCR